MIVEDDNGTSDDVVVDVAVSDMDEDDDSNDVSDDKVGPVKDSESDTEGKGVADEPAESVIDPLDNGIAVVEGIAVTSGDDDDGSGFVGVAEGCGFGVCETAALDSGVAFGVSVDVGSPVGDTRPPYVQTPSVPRGI